MVDLPSGWEPDLAEGDLVGVAVADDGGLVLTREAGRTPRATTATTAEPRSSTPSWSWGAPTGVPLAGDDDPWVLDLVDALLQVAADRPEVADGLARPLTEVLDEAGLAYGGGFLAGPGVAEHRLRLFSVGADVLGGPWADAELLDQAEALGTTWMLLLGRGDEEIPERARAVAVAASLGDPDVAIALARHVRTSRRRRRDRRWSARITAAADVDPALPGPAQLLAEVGGPRRSTRGRRSTGWPGPTADVDDVDWAEALELLGHLRAVAGDLDGAARALARIELHDTVTYLDRWRAASGAVGGPQRPVSRAARAASTSSAAWAAPPGPRWPTGSSCCGGRPAPGASGPRGWPCPGPRPSTRPQDGDADALVLDLALVADDALAAFTVELGPLLPADEAALVETWLERPHRLWEVGEVADGAVALADLTGPGDGAAVDGRAPPDARPDRR